MSASIFDSIKADIDNAIRENLVTPALVDRGKGWMDQLKREYPILHKILMSVVFGEPEQVLKALAMWDIRFKGLHKNPVALKYVRQLQATLNGESA